MDPVLERELEAAARRQGLTKSQFIVDAVERALGRKNPYDLLLQAQEEVAEYRIDAKEPVAAGAKPGSTKERVRAVLAEKRAAGQRQWADEHASPAVAKRGSRGK
jgi:RHH-type rel operon transcriptional repressor/antitoxin RelB